MQNHEIQGRGASNGQTKREDTIRLLRECDAGIKMGTSSIREVLPETENRKLKQMLQECMYRHERLGKEVETALERFGDEGKDPGLMAQAMSWLKTNGKLSVDGSDRTIADLMTDGANMGAKSLRKYMNQYSMADEDAREIAGRLAAMEEQLVEELRPFL